MDKPVRTTWAVLSKPMRVLNLALKWRALDVEYDRAWNEAREKYGAADMFLPQVSERLIPLMNKRDVALLKLRKAIDSLEAGREPRT